MNDGRRAPLTTSVTKAPMTDYSPTGGVAHDVEFHLVLEATWQWQAPELGRCHVGEDDVIRQGHPE